MKIKILGTRGKIEEQKPRHRKYSGVLVDNKLLFDLGEKEYLDDRPEYIIFTHFHPDHAWFIEGKGKKVKLGAEVYAPEKSDLILDKVHILSAPVRLDDYKITPVPTIHSVKVKSQGYVIERENNRLFYSGDMAWIEKKYHHLLQNLDMVITDGSYFRKGGMIRRDKSSGQIFGHTGMPNLVKLFKSFTKRIVFTHFGSWFMENVPEAKKKIKSLEEDDLKVEAAYDGKEYEL